MQQHLIFSIGCINKACMSLLELDKSPLYCLNQLNWIYLVIWLKQQSWICASIWTFNHHVAWCLKISVHSPASSPDLSESWPWLGEPSSWHFRSVRPVTAKGSSTAPPSSPANLSGFVTNNRDEQQSITAADPGVLWDTSVCNNVRHCLLVRDCVPAVQPLPARAFSWVSEWRVSVLLGPKKHIYSKSCW